VQGPHGDAGRVGKFADAPFLVAVPAFRHRNEPTT
jgi:hypothetical protein